MCMRSTPPCALLISPTEGDTEFLRSLFDEQSWILYAAPSLPSGSRILRDVVASVVITEADLPLGTWRDVLNVMSVLLDPPLVIVTSIHADDYLWVEALNLGAYDVLAKPFDKAEVIRVVTAAWRHSETPDRQNQASTARKAE